MFSSAPILTTDPFYLMEEHWLGSKEEKLPVALFDIQQLTWEHNITVMSEMALAGIKYTIILFGLASHRHRKVTGSNPVQVLNLSGFFTQ